MNCNLSLYTSPSNEVSYYKNIPIEHLAEVQQYFKNRVKENFSEIPKGLRYVFRGPRYDALKVSTRKRHAFAFSVYKRG